MQTLGNAREHFFRVIKMANANKVDLSTALDQRMITSGEYADMITGCRGCAHVEKCDRLLAEKADLTEAPGYCVNRATFAELQQN